MRKEESKNRRWPLIFLAFLIVVAVVFKIYSWQWPVARVSLGGKELNVFVSDTYSHWIKGLSDRESLGGKDGMMFVFKRSEQHSMVMRDMKFPLDIVWVAGLAENKDKSCSLNKLNFRKFLTGVYHSCEGVVVDIAPNLVPENTISIDKLTPYFARDNSSIVLELPAGWVKANGLKIGDKLEILD